MLARRPDQVIFNKKKKKKKRKPTVIEDFAVPLDLTVKTKKGKR